MAKTDSKPFILVIFGATGDLTKRKLIPAIFSLYKLGLLADDFKIIAFARRPFDNRGFVETLLPFIEETDHDNFKNNFAKNINYLMGDFDSQDSYQSLKQVIREYETDNDQCLSKLYYMAVSPDILPGVIDNLGSVGLHIGCGEDGKWSRIIVEKPFGHDLESAKVLNKQLSTYFNEDQIYRIDHYLGKETVQNLLAIRFANIFFRPVWSSEFIESIQISATESLGVEERGGYYDHTGALRDMVQSHLLQLVALTTMDEPELYDASVIREQKNKILSSLIKYDVNTIKTDVVRGQYVSSKTGELSYRQEAKIDPESNTETFVAMKLFIDNEKFKDVPIFIRTGKKLASRATDIHIKFKKANMSVFSNLFCELRSNVLSIRLQPNEGTRIRVLIKEPGFGVRLNDVQLEYLYHNSHKDLPEAYERLILDCLSGDQSLFTRSDEIESSWRFITNILDLWQQENIKAIPYQSGSMGPEEANALTSWIE